jgi:hypothetical protein
MVRAQPDRTGIQADEGGRPETVGRRWAKRRLIHQTIAEGREYPRYFIDLAGPISVSWRVISQATQMGLHSLCQKHGNAEYKTSNRLKPVKKHELGVARFCMRRRIFLKALLSTIEGMFVM